jgi:hypothetical protein
MWYDTITLGNITILTKNQQQISQLLLKVVLIVAFYLQTQLFLDLGKMQPRFSFYMGFGDGSALVTTALSAPQNIIIPISGTYTVTLTAQNGCGITAKRNKLA